MSKILLALFALLAFFSTLAYAQAQTQANTSFQQPKLYSFIETWYGTETSDNKTVNFYAAYAQNSTGLLKLIEDGSCKISFSDLPAIQNPMQPLQGIGYKYTRTFTEPKKISYTVDCVHTAYPQQSKTKEADIIFEFYQVNLLEPTGTIKNKTIIFICEAVGTKPDAINLYTDTSGEWKLRASIQVRPAKSPYRVNFREDNVGDGQYSWNCEAQKSGGSLFAARNQTFKVRYSPNITCNENSDCSQWRPDSCTSSGLQTRACNNTAFCKYQEGRKCTYITETNKTGGDKGVVLIDNPAGKDSSGTPRTASGGPDFLVILLVAAVIAAGGFAVFKIRKKKPGKQEEEEEYNFDEEPGEDGETEADEEK